MPKIKERFYNQTKISFLIGGLILFFILSILIPLLCIYYLTFSGIGHFFSENFIYIIVSAVILMYFILVGGYYYNIKIDAYVIDVTSYRPIFSLFKKKDFVDIPHSMLVNYAFFNRPLSFNKTLMLKIENNRKKKVIKRFNLTLISKKEIKQISRAFDIIIAKKN